MNVPAVSPSSLFTAKNASCLISGLLFIVTAHYIVTIINNVCFHPLKRYPGPKLFAASQLPLQFSRLRGRYVQTVSVLHEKYGQVVRIGPNELSFIDSRAWKDIYNYGSGGKIGFRKDPVFYGPDVFGTNGIIRADDINHSRQRRIFSHAFSDKALKDQEYLIRKYVDELIVLLSERAEYQQHNPKSKDSHIDMVKMYNFTTFDVMSDLTFGEPLNLLSNANYSPWVTDIFGNVKAIGIAGTFRAYPLLNRCFQFLLPRSLKQKRMNHIRYSMDKVNRRMAVKTERPDIWNLVIRNVDAQQITPEEMYSNAAAFMVGGTETTATLLSGLTYILCKNPLKMQKLVDEIRAFQRPTDLTIHNLQGLKYLNACLQEGLRHYPPVPIAAPRITPPGGAIICSQWVPEKVIVGVPQFAAYHSDTSFTDPFKFEPERWTPEADARYANDNKAVYNPFSTGPRNCIGKNLANHEMRIILSSVLWHFDISLVDEGDDWLDQKVYVIWEKKPLFVRLTPVVR